MSEIPLYGVLTLRGEGQRQRMRGQESERETCREANTGIMCPPPHRLWLRAGHTGVPRSSEIAFPQDCKVGLRLGLLAMLLKWRHFLVSEVPLKEVVLQLRRRLRLRGGTDLQGYFARKKTPTPLRPLFDPRHRPTEES